MIDPLIQIAISIALAGLLLAAAVHKILNIERFAATLREYRLLPSAWSRSAALSLASVEATLAFAWVLGLCSNFVPPATAVLTFGIGRNFVPSATALLMLVYATAIAINLVRGRVHIDCGCGFSDARTDNTSLSWRLVARNVALALLGLTGGLPGTGRELAVYDWLTLVFAVASGALLIGVAIQLARNHSVMTWNRRRD